MFERPPLELEDTYLGLFLDLDGFYLAIVLFALALDIFGKVFVPIFFCFPTSSNFSRAGKLVRMQDSLFSRES